MPYQDHLKTCTTEHQAEWDGVLEEIGRYDFYHMASFHRLAEIRGEGEAVMPVFREHSHIIAFPMLLRMVEIPGIGPVGTMRDATSVYGYAGPFASSGDVPESVLNHFVASLQEFYVSRRVVCAFSRLHPLFSQENLLKGYGEVVEIGVTASVDLTLPPETQVANYRKSNRYELQNLRKNGFRCIEVGTDYLDKFIRIYHETMDRVGADAQYYFDRPYFEYLLKEMSGVIHMFACLDGETVACVGLFSVCGNIVQYHLAGTSESYRNTSPMKLMIDTVRSWGREMGAETLHLGGGVGAQRDSLWKFKMGFGSREHAYSTWRHIIDQQAYDKLCCKAGCSPDRESSTSFFPEYRKPELSAAGDTSSISSVHLRSR